MNTLLRVSARDNMRREVQACEECNIERRDETMAMRSAKHVLVNQSCMHRAPMRTQPMNIVALR